MKATYYKGINFLIGLCTLLMLGCQLEDDTDKLKQIQSLKQKSTTKTISGKDAPEVLHFILSKSNSRMQFTLDNNDSPKGQFRSHEESLSLTTTITEQIKQVTNGYGKSNYTFKLIEEETKDGVYFLNLVVKEYKDTFYLYIAKYVPDLDWLLAYNSSSDFNSFTGSIYYYSDTGLYLAKIEMLNGSSTFVEKHPCDGEGVDSGDGGNPGGGSPSDAGTSDGSTSSDSNSGDNAGGTGGSNVDVIFTCCECNGDLVGEHDHVECTIEIIFNLSTNSDGQILGDEKSFNDYLRHPCDIPEVCYETNGDPCTYGCNESGDGCAENPNENDDVGVYIDLEETIALNELTELFGDDNFATDYEIDPETIPAELHFETLEELEEFLLNLQNSEVTLTSEVIINEANNSVTTRCVFSDFLLNYNVWVEQELGEDYINFFDYSVSDVTSFDSGITVFHYYEQNSWSNQLNSYNSITDVYGTAHLTFIYKGIGRIMSDVQHFQIVTNATNGSVISQEWIDKWVFD